MPAEQKEGLVHIPRIGALDTGSEGAGIEGNKNWHALSAAITVLVENLSHRSLPELIGGLRQLEEMLPDLGTDIGLQKDALDLPKVGPVKKLAAIIFERWLPALHKIVRRAEMREEATARLTSLEKVRDQLAELRAKLADQIDKVLEMNLKETSPNSYAKCSGIRDNERLHEAWLERLKKLLDEDQLLHIVDKNETYIVGAELTMGRQFSPFLQLWKEADEATFNVVCGREPEELGRKYISIRELISHLEGLRVKLSRKLEDLKNERQAIILPQVKVLLGEKETALLTAKSDQE